MIPGSEKMTTEEMDFTLKVNENQRRAFGTDSRDYEISKVWKQDGVICVKLRNGDWYHYLNNGTWY